MSKPKIYQLMRLLSYQKGAVVSKELVNKPEGTITLFAFAKNQGLSEHKTPYLAFLYILEGKTEIKIQNRVHQLTTNEALIIPAGQSHSLKALTDFKMLLIMIKTSEVELPS